MKPSKILEMWQADVQALSSIKPGEPWTEITLPYATLTDKFVRVFVRSWPNRGGFTVSDCGDLRLNTYECEGFSSLSAAYALQGRHFFDEAKIGSFSDHHGQRFLKHIADEKLLTAGLADMAFFIQAAVNYAAVTGHQILNYGK